MGYLCIDQYPVELLDELMDLIRSDNTAKYQHVALTIPIVDLERYDNLFRNSELKVSDVAVHLGTNTRYVTDCIKSCRGCTFTQLVNGYRVEYAKQLLRKHPDKKIFEVYTEAGFASETSFFRIFKSVTGMTTREWMQQLETPS